MRVLVKDTFLSNQMKRLTLFLTTFFLVLTLSATTVAGAYFFLDRTLPKGFCESPREYFVDSIDSRFGLSRQEFTTAVEKAAVSWNSLAGKELFTSVAGADLDVNLVFDDRQDQKNRIGQLEMELGQGKAALESDIQEYETLKAAFQERLQTFNEQVDYWNSQGGAPKNEYDRLQREQKELQDESSSLNALAQKLNRATTDYNRSVGELGQAVGDFNSTLTLKPEEGIFSPAENRIEVYFADNREELVRTLQHEFGHSLGLEHSNQPDSVMFPFVNQTTTFSAADKQGLDDYCKEWGFEERLRNSLPDYLKKFN